MPLCNVTPEPECCEYNDLIEIDGYYTTIENVDIDRVHSAVIVHLYAQDDPPRYVHSIEVPVDKARLDEVTESISPEWIQAICQYQVMQDYSSDLAHHLGGGVRH